VGLAHSPSIVTNGLVLCLDAGNRKSYPGSGTTWTDLSRRGNNGTLTNGPTYNSSNGGYFTFVPSSQYVTIPFSSNFPTGSSARTLCAFFNIFSLTGGRSVFAIGGNASDGNRTNLWVGADNSIGVECRNSGTVTYTSWSGINTWVYLCATNAAGGTAHSFKIYINGQQRSVVNFGTSTLNTSNAACVVGTIPESLGSNSFDGRISNVALYNRELSAAEVQQNFNSLRGRYGI
jgi:hypothetical protein